MSQLRFDGKVVIVTGAGVGIGKAHALYFASRGAKVLVNDNGSSVNGEGTDPKVADAVVEEIKKLGGVAVANYDSVEFGDKVVKAAVDAFGTVDVIVNNAGFLRDVSFVKMTDQDWDLIMRTHLKGAFAMSKAAWKIMRDKEYGRIIFTSSSAGMFGSFGQTNYATAKLGLFGFAQTLAKEGEKKNIKVNAIVPLAGTRMTQTVMPPEIFEVLRPEYITPMVAVLAHESCPESGGLFEVGGGYFGRTRWNRSEGHLFPLNEINPESVLQKWEQIGDYTNGTFPTSNQDMMSAIIKNITIPAVVDTNQTKRRANTPPASSSPTSAALSTAPAQAQTQVAAPQTPAAPVSDVKADAIFGMMKTYLDQGLGKDIIPKVQGTYGFEIVKVKGAKPVATFEIDLKNGQGDVRKGVPKVSPDATFTMTDDDFQSLCMGQLQPQMAFMQGKMKIRGNMGKANKFTPELFPPPNPENLVKFAPTKL